VSPLVVRRPWGRAVSRYKSAWLGLRSNPFYDRERKKGKKGDWGKNEELSDFPASLSSNFKSRSHRIGSSAMNVCFLYFPSL
jgi:hypothetical protein